MRITEDVRTSMKMKLMIPTMKARHCLTAKPFICLLHALAPQRNQLLSRVAKNREKYMPVKRNPLKKLMRLHQDFATFIKEHPSS